MIAEDGAPAPGSSKKGQRPLKKRPSFGRKAILVLGMHRSGTSALSGLLTNVGCDGPANPMLATSMNPKGYFESDPICRLHEEIFLSAGTSWDDFRPFPQDWLRSPKADEFRSRMQELVASEYGESSLFVVKDPRICRMLPFWTDVLTGMGIQPLAVLTHRNPLEVATSLVERDLMDRAYAEFLWLCHVIEAEHGTRQMTRAFTSYERLLKNWVPEVRRLGEALDLTWPRFTAANAATYENFVDPKLRHFVTDPAAVLQNELLSDWIRDAYSILENWATFGASASDYPKLDAVRRQYTPGARAFGPLVHSRGRAIARDRDNVLRKLTEMEAALKEQQSAVAERSAEKAQALSEVEKLSASNKDLKGQLAQREADFTQLTAETERMSEACRDLETRLAKAKQELLELREQADRDIAMLSVDVARYRNESEQVDSLRSDLAEARQALMRSHRTINDTAEALSRLAGRLSGVSGRGAPDLAAAVTRLESAVEAMLMERSDAVEELRKLAIEKEAMINSRSWRITAPLRAIQRRFPPDPSGTNPTIASRDVRGTS